jgi:phospholipid/cholesterol/gamma-HCH transport system substrate-binding protein
MTRKASNVRVGIFLVIAVAALFVTVFLLGTRQSIFTRKAHLRAAFADTSGLVVGTSVRLAGVDVGIVEKIRFEPNLRERKVVVQLGINSGYLERIRQDSIARLSSKGLLGDMVVDIAVGGADAPPLRDGDEIATQESAGLTEVVHSVQEAISEVRTLTRLTTARIDQLVSDQVVHDFGRTMHSVADITDEAAHGRGAVHALLHDPAITDDLRTLGDASKRIGVSASRAFDRVEALLKQEGVQQLPGELARATTGLADAVGQIRDGEGLLHTLLYTPDESNLVADLAAFSRTLRQLGDEVGEGKGTVGALLKDPTVYTDLKLLLGNVNRSRILRALVRFTISRDGLRASPPQPATPAQP